VLSEDGGKMTWDPNEKSILLFTARSPNNKHIDDCHTLIFSDIRNGRIGNHNISYFCVREAELIITALGKDANLFRQNYDYEIGAPTIDDVFSTVYGLTFNTWKKKYSLLKVGLACSDGSFSIINGTIGITESAVKKPTTIVNGFDGSICSGPCGNFVPYAESNQPNGSYICFNCR
jgi:hypothetical protein